MTRTTLYTANIARLGKLMGMPLEADADKIVREAIRRLEAGDNRRSLDYAISVLTHTASQSLPDSATKQPG